MEEQNDKNVAENREVQERGEELKENIIEEKKQEESKKVEGGKKETGPSFFGKIKNKLSEYRRVIAVASKPDKEEFVSSVKITGFGILLIGVIGFIIYLTYVLVT